MADESTVVGVRNAEPRGKRYGIADGLVPGMRLVVLPSGKKSYVIMTRVHGKLVTFTLGDAALLSLADAREKAKTILRRIGNGEDPRATKQEAVRAASETVEVVARQYLDDPKVRKNRTWIDIKRQVEGELIPRWGKLPISSIGLRDISSLTAPIVKRDAPAMANRVFETVRRVFRWALSKGLITTSPFDHAELPAPKQQSRERVLTDLESALIWQAADALGFPSGPIIKLLFLTAARRSEIAEMEWGEFSSDMTAWTLPRERSKNDRPLELPLPRMAQTILKSLPRIDGSKFVFTASGDRPINSFRDACKRINRMIAATTGKTLPHYTVHDIRRTGVTNLERLGVPPHVIERIVNHVVPGVAGVYRRYDYKLEKAEALELLAKHMEVIVGEVPKMTEAMKMTARVYRMLTVENIKGLKFSGSRQQRKLVRDSGGPDLFLSIAGSGKRTWVLLRDVNGKRKYKTLGLVDLSGAKCRRPALGKPLSPEAARILAQQMAGEPAPA